MKKIAVIVLFLTVTLSVNGQTKDAMEKFDTHFVHTVYFWLKNPNNEADRQKFERALQTFLEASKYAQTNFIGTPPQASRDVVDGSFTYSLVVTFASAEEQEHYQKEAAHVQFVEECEALWTKVIVYDSNGI